MPSNKNQKPNAFMKFTFEWKKKYGSPHMSIKECIAKAGKIWEKMPPEERKVYKDKQETAGSMKNDKRSCVGRSGQTMVSSSQNNGTEERQMRRYIEAIVRDSLKNAELEMKEFIFISVNYFTKSLSDDICVPAEISLSAFSLQDGVYRVYHTLINPGFTIFGHQYETVQHSENTHKLPIPPNALGESNMQSIYRDVLEFVRDKNTGELPALYTDENEISIVKSVLKFIKSEASDISNTGIEESNTELKVHPIQYLFYILKEAICHFAGLNAPASIHITNSYFQRDSFEYQSDIGCEYHEKQDRSKYCAQSCVIRWGFMFAEYMCGDLAIKLRPGRHFPDNSNFKCDIIVPNNDRPNLRYQDIKCHIKNEKINTDFNSAVPYLRHKTIKTERADHTDEESSDLIKRENNFCSTLNLRESADYSRGMKLITEAIASSSKGRRIQKIKEEINYESKKNSFDAPSTSQRIHTAVKREFKRSSDPFSNFTNDSAQTDSTSMYSNISNSWRNGETNELDESRVMSILDHNRETSIDATTDPWQNFQIHNTESNKNDKPPSPQPPTPPPAPTGLKFEFLEALSEEWEDLESTNNLSCNMLSATGKRTGYDNSDNDDDNSDFALNQRKRSCHSRDSNSSTYDWRNNDQNNQRIRYKSPTQLKEFHYGRRTPN